MAGVVFLSATAADNVGVDGVRFSVDGVALSPTPCRVGWGVLGLLAGGLGCDRAQLADDLPLGFGHFVDVQPTAMARLQNRRWNIEPSRVSMICSLSLHPPVASDTRTNVRCWPSSHSSTVIRSASTTAAPADPPTPLASRGSHAPPRLPARWDSRRHRLGRGPWSVSVMLFPSTLSADRAGKSRCWPPRRLRRRRRRPGTSPPCRAHPSPGRRRRSSNRSRIAPPRAFRCGDALPR